MKIYRYVKKNHINEQYMNGQTKYYSDTVRTAIIKAFSTKKTVQPFERLEQHDVDVDVLFLLKQQVNKQAEELKIKNKQIENKDSQISQMQNLLDQQQRLALQDKKLLEEYKSEINDLKALKIPLEDMKEEQSSYRSLEKEKDFVQTIQESYESEIKVLNQKLAEQEEQLQEIQKEKETKEKKWFQFWK